MEGTDMAVKTTAGLDTAVEQVRFEGGSETGKESVAAWDKLLYWRAGVR